LYVRSAGQADAGVNWETEKRVAGLRFVVGPLEFELIAESADLNFDVIRQKNFYRPSAVDLTGKRRDANILLSGPTFARNESMRLQLWETGT
jgi:hypothetical protein